MIKYKSVNGLPVDEQGNLVECKYSLVQGDYVLVFDSNEELMAYINPDVNIYKRGLIEQQAEDLFDQALADNWYSRFDVQFYATQGEQIAIDLMTYYDFLWSTIEANFADNDYDFELPTFDIRK